MENNPKFAVIGGGSWATAIAKMLCENQSEIAWYMRSTYALEHLKHQYHNPNYLSSVEFDIKKLRLTNDINEAIAFADYIIFAIPSAFLSGELEKLTESLEGKKILVQGVGHVGETLVKYITEEGAQVIINDINEARLEELSKKYHTNVILGNDIYNLDLDIYAPCALGATINDETIHQLNTKVIAGAANNQLADEVKHGRILKEKGIAYAPDFLINAGGIINVYGELEGYTKEESIRKTENIYNTTLEIFKHSDNS